ncbi:MAG: L-arabinose isomerase [Phycisphaerae bacterium]|nr:L-arabinose isomerase [Phycisphaerae bacterium]
MANLRKLEVWFVTGSQHLYGPEALKQVAENAKTIAQALSKSDRVPVKVVFKPVMTRPEDITGLMIEANTAKNCIGLITWMHTFSPSKMWIAGFSALRKPFVHLHTQFNRELPWSSIDMDFMNLNQSAHGDREHGFICTRLRKNRKVIVGHWQDLDVQEKLGVWMRAAAAWHDSQGAKIVRFGDNMREVAVTEGDKVEAQIRMGYDVYGYGIGDLANAIRQVTDREANQLMAEYDECYDVAKPLRKDGRKRSSLREAARIELGLKAFLESGPYTAFTTTFEDLHGLVQLPGLAVQRLMASGYGFGAEGDWKTAALVRAMKVMATGLPGGTSFMEDYTYHLDPVRPMVLGAHMLEVCESIADGRPSLEIHPLGIGGKADPCRLVFNTASGPGVNASLIDLGNRFRLIVNPVDVVDPRKALPHLPVARVVWVPQPDLKVGAAAWILAGGAHHTGFSMALTPDHLVDFADMAGIETVCIDHSTTLGEFKKELRWNEVYYMLGKALQ